MNFPDDRVEGIESVEVPSNDNNKVDHVVLIYLIG